MRQRLMVSDRCVPVNDTWVPVYSKPSSVAFESYIFSKRYFKLMEINHNSKYACQYNPNDYFHIMDMPARCVYLFDTMLLVMLEPGRNRSGM